MEAKRPICPKCSYYFLKRQLDSGTPFQYYGDIPCVRCRHHTVGLYDEFIPSEKEISIASWNNLNKGD